MSPCIKSQCVAVLLCFLSLLANNALAQSRAEKTEALVAQWVGLERQADQLQQQWQQQKQVLEHRKELLLTEKKLLQGRLSQYGEQQSKTQVVRADLARQQSKLENNQQALAAVLSQLKTVFGELQSRLPPPLQSVWEKQLTSAEAAAQSSQKLNHYLELLGSADLFENQVGLHQTVMALDGKEVLVDQVYLGLGQGWYVSRDGTQAGVGQSTKAGWQWQSEPLLAPQVQHILDILHKPESAKLVGVTVMLKEPAQ